LCCQLVMRSLRLSEHLCVRLSYSFFLSHTCMNIFSPIFFDIFVSSTFLERMKYLGFGTKRSKVKVTACVEKQSEAYMCDVCAYVQFSRPIETLRCIVANYELPAQRWRKGSKFTKFNVKIFFTFHNIFTVPSKLNFTNQLFLCALART